MGVRLPAEYQEVEYLGKALTSSNTTDVYIDTGILTSSEIDYDFVGQALGDNETVTFFGGRDAFKSKSNEVVYTLHHASVPTGAQFRYGNKAGDTAVFAESPAVNVNGIKHYKKEGTVFICNDSSSTTTAQTFSYNKTITLFDVNQRAGMVGNAGGVRIFYFKLYKSGVLVRDYIPCYRKSDNEPGMYDLVSGTFFTNVGTGEFLVGPDVIGSISPLMVAWRRGLMHNVSRYIYEASNLSFNGTSDCINTGVYLFTQENIDRDFEFIAEGIVGNGNIHAGESTIICAKYDTDALGFLVRPTGSTSLNYKGTIFVKRNINSTVIIRRINGVITLSGTNITNPTVQFTNAVFNHPLVFGCALQDDGTPYRYCQGTIAHVTVRWL